MAALIANAVQPQAIYLFGSYAYGKPTWESDIDLAIISEDLAGHPIDDFVHLMKLRRGIDLRIEPHPFRPEDFTADNPEAAEIMRTGIRIL
ncbi:MAG: nucleotidyltransferase domain-containing protein [bacterium]